MTLSIIVILLCVFWGFAVRVDPTEQGDYRICFDNSFSRISEKRVYVEVIVDGPEENDEGDEDWAALAEPEDSLEYKLEDIRVHKSQHLIHLPSLQFLLLLDVDHVHDKYQISSRTQQAQLLCENIFYFQKRF